MMDREQFCRLHGRDAKETAACVALVKQHWPEDLAHRLRIADEVMEHRFLFDLPWDMEQTTVPVCFDGEIDWQYQPGDDPEFVYQLNRHRYWVCLGQAYAVTGEERYARCFVNQLQHWIDANPITEQTKKTTWRTIEAGLRAESWIKSMGYMINSPAVTDEVWNLFLDALIRHGNYLAACEVPFSTKSNWGVLENSGLYMIGKVAEQFLPDNGFSKLAKKRLLKQIRTQILDDGVHWEQSPMYHNEVLKCYLEVLRVAACYQEKLPEEMVRRVRQMAGVNLIWQKPDGTQPAMGDSDVTDLRDLLSVCACWFQDPDLKSGGFDCLDYEGIWDYGSEAWERYQKLDSRTPEETFFQMKESGNWYLRSGWQADSDYFHFRCGSLGGGHGHFDKLHIDLFSGGDEFFTDPGRYTYVDGKERRELKGSLSHNSISADGEDYSRCLDAWDVLGLGLPVNGFGCRKGDFTLMQCGHLGYMPKGIWMNRKIIAIKTNQFIIVDEACTTGKHSYEQHYHIPAAIDVQPMAGGWRLQGAGSHVELTHLSAGCEKKQEQCSLSRHYNQLEAGQRLSVQLEAEGNATLISVVNCQHNGTEQPFSAQLVSVEAPVTGRTLDRTEAEAVLIEDGASRYVVVIAHVDAGSDCEYIGACGCYGLGRVMAADLNAAEPEMTILQW